MADINGLKLASYQISEMGQDNLPEELYVIAKNAIQEFCLGLERVINGISGGIDSAVSTAAFVDALGPNKVLGIHMPFSLYSTSDDYRRAKELAENLDIEFRVIPIDSIVTTIATACGVEEGTLGYENIQARARMEVLAATAQQVGGVFVCNSNKVEAVFGYGTLYGDISGALAPLADMVKREVYQLGDYLNRKVFRFNVIPLECFSVAPSARLNKNQVNPFHYGNWKDAAITMKWPRRLPNSDWVRNGFSVSTLRNPTGEH